MPDYQKGKIYKIVTLNNEKDVYVGSTVKHYLCDRFQKHKQNFKNNEPCSSKEILKHGDAKIVLIENFPCDSKDELHARELYHIKQCKNNGFNVVNILMPGKTEEEKKALKAKTDKAYREAQGEILKEKKKEYYEANKEKHAERAKKYREENAELIKQRKKAYYEANKEAIRAKHTIYADTHKEQKKEMDIKYYEANKEKSSEYGKKLIICTCGLQIKQSNKSQHLKTEKHLSFIN
jgi:hypothetical protein